MPLNSLSDEFDRAIAIVGIGCRYPGGVNSVKTYWELLTQKVNAVGKIPLNRMDVNSLYDQRPATPGKIMSQWGGYLEHIDQFDASFFGISPREAERLDPQQRLLLEVAWEAMQDAGEVISAPAMLHGGVFVGCWLNDYEGRLFGDPDQIDFYMTTGSGRYSISGRLSYFLGMQGPSLTVDTACSSSLVAVHLACQSLRAGECSIALAGGVNVILQPNITIAYSQSRMMAPDGKCKFGDERGDGYVRSEGAALIALKRLPDALADNNPIYAIIQGSAVNNDGRSSGSLTTPGGAGQEDMLRKAYRNARVSPAQVQYVEAHGTGTRAGDPVEIQALGAVFKEGRSAGSYCSIGSVKTNFGHAEGAAGIAGLIKVALSLKNKYIPASLNFQQPNSNIPWQDIPIRVQVDGAPWPEHEGPAVAGVSAFGIAGTNAHIVLQEAPAVSSERAPAASETGEPSYLLPLSAQSPAALRDLVGDYRKMLTGEQPPSLHDLCYTASVRRTHHDHRTAFVANSPLDFVEQFSQYAEEWQVESVIPVEPGPRKILFVFPGQGSQWVGMGRRLMEHEPVFCRVLERCSQIIETLTGWSLIERLFSSDAAMYLEQIDFIQPALFALQVSLAEQWKAWGIVPAAVVGHSMGEIAAAHIAGVLSLEDAARVICFRSRLMKTVSGKGSMFSVDLSYDEAQAELIGVEDQISIAVSNSPRSTVLSGDPAALEVVIARLKSREILCRQVKVDVAAHSPIMDSLRPMLQESLQGLQPHSNPVNIYSTVTGQLEDGAAFDIAYWGRNLRQPVLFSTTIQHALKDGFDTVIEISPHPVLLAAVEQCRKTFYPELAANFATLASARRGEDEKSILLQSVGKLYNLGHPISWELLYPEGGACITTPAYPWQREHFWMETHRPDGVGSYQYNDQPLREKNAAQADVPNVGQWLYELEWQPAPRQTAATAAPHLPTNWLILSDRSGLGQTLSQALEQQGDTCALVFSDSPDRAAEWIRQNSASGQDRPQGILYLSGGDLPVQSEKNLDALEKAIGVSCLRVQQIIQRAAAVNWRQAPKVWLITSDAQAVGPGHTVPSLELAPLWGLGRVIAEEHPDMWGGLIDLSPSLTADQAVSFLVEEIRDSRETQVAFYDNQRLVLRLTQHKPKTSRPEKIHWQANASYLITGGLGGIGTEVARWMVQQGARRLILMSRTPLPPRVEWSQVEPDSSTGQRIAAVRALEALGASIHIAVVDVADEEQFAHWLETYKLEGWPPIRGVVHAAGVLSDQLVTKIQAKDWETVLRPKVRGAWLLHSLLDALDFFITFSSIGSVLGPTGHGSYAAANAFLDALVYHRRSKGLAALSINWSVWEGVGMSMISGGKVTLQALESQGMAAIQPDQGIAALAQLIGQQNDEQGAAQAVVLPTDWERLQQSHLSANRRNFFATQIAAVKPKSPELAKVSIRETLLALEPLKRQRELEKYLQLQISHVLKLPPARIAPSKPLGSYGLDSLMGIELRGCLQAALDITLSATFVWNYPTLAQMVPYIAEKMGISLTETSQAPLSKVVVTEEITEPGEISIDDLLADIELQSDESVQQTLTNKNPDESPHE